MKTLRIVLLGAGTVGGAFVELLSRHESRLAALGYQIELAKVLVRDSSKPRPENLAGFQITTNPEGILEGADLVVELMGGTGLAKELLLKAVNQGLPVITANKALLAEAWKELSSFNQLYYEASVMAGMPVLTPLAEVLRGSQTLELHAIANGTCNYMISRMEQGVAYAEALAEAQAKGFAEADPTLDVGGWDTAHKLTLLARLAVNPTLSWSQVKPYVRGIDQLTPNDFVRASSQNKVIRLVGSIYPEPVANEWRTTIRPVMLPKEHPLVQASSSENVFLYRGDAVGELVIKGRGAGGYQTASGVLGDLYRYLQGALGQRVLPEALAVPDYQAEKLEDI